MKRMRERSRRVWARVRRELQAADVPPEQETALAREARRQLRLRRHAQKKNVYEARGVGGLVLLRLEGHGWEWHHPDWDMRPVGPYATQRAALAAWAVAMGATGDNQ